MTDPNAARDDDASTRARAGRLGRLRYFAYCAWSLVALVPIFIAAVAIAGAVDSVALMNVLGLAALAYQFYRFVGWTVRRLDDIGWNRWFTVVFMLPVANWALWAVPGTRGVNARGPEPPPNTAKAIWFAVGGGLGCAFIALAVAISIPAYGDYAVRAKLQEGINLSNPPRTAVGIACSEGDLATGMSHAALGLDPPEAMSGNHIRSVTVSVDGPGTATVTIVTREIGHGIEDGMTIIYDGTCVRGEMRWNIEGSVPSRYLRRRHH